jgi:AbrB family looped-hinge helix DNA binding protein
VATTIYKAKVRRDGALTMPKTMRERLHLHEGDEVEVAVSTPAQKNVEDNWAENFARECDELCRKFGYGDAPADFAATWKQDKQRRILEQNSRP